MENIFMIKELLKERGLTQTDLAEQIGLTQTSVTRIVNGEQQPKADTMLAIAKALDVDLKDLFISTKEASGDVHNIYIKDAGGKDVRIGAINKSML